MQSGFPTRNTDFPMVLLNSAAQRHHIPKAWNRAEDNPEEDKCPCILIMDGYINSRDNYILLVYYIGGNNGYYKTIMGIISS